MKFKWGIIGTGKIAKRFAADLLMLPEAALVGAAGRNFESTQKFCAEYSTAPFSTVDELLSSEVEIIYIATPHPEHHPLTLKAIAAGKAVLCEKPFAMNVNEAKDMIAYGRVKKIFLMEAMWTRFFPAIREVVALVKSGAIGELKSIEACFGFHSEFAPDSRLYNKSLGGGSLLDIGVYCLALTSMLVSEEPCRVTGSGKFSSTGVDESAEWEQAFPSGVISRGRSTILKVLSNEAIITGSKGEIRVPKFWCPKEFYLNGELRAYPFQGMGLHFEAREVMDCLSKGSTESRIQTHDDTLDVMRWLEQVKQVISSR